MSKQIVSLASGGLFGVAGKVASKALGKSKSAEPPPAPSQPIVMPTTDDEEVRRARRRAIAERMQRGGRSSTILTDQDTLGG